MNRNKFFPVLLVLIVLLAAAACSIRRENVKDQNPTPTVQTVSAITPTTERGNTAVHLPLIFQNNHQETSTPIPQVVETPIPTQEPSPTATFTPCVPPPGWVVYIVQSGDTLFDIGLRYGMTAKAIQEANCLPLDDSTIFVGQKIYVPFLTPTSTSTVMPVTLTPTQTPTSTPITPSPTPPIPEGLLEEIYFDPGGENEVPVCGDPTPGVTPQITISERVKDAYEMCVYGFPVGEQITVELYAPDGHLVASKALQVQGDVVRIPLWMPVGVPIGTWSAVAQSATNMTEKSIAISPFVVPAINTTPLGEINPFENHKCDIYSPGENVMIHGTNFGAYQNLPVGFYLWTPDVPLDNLGRYILPLVKVQLAGISQGDFSIQVSIQPSDSAGVYWVIPVFDLNEEVYRRIDIKNDCYQVP